jgi:DNA-binding PadR family transcriptional regulator
VDITANVLRISRSLLDVSDNRRYGYELMRETGLRSPSMYKALHRMQDAGWLTSYLEVGDPKLLGRRRRRYYVLTDEGRQHAQDNLRLWVDALRGNPAAA